MKKRTLRPEERQIWAKVAATVTPSPGRYVPKPEPEVVKSEPAASGRRKAAAAADPKPKAQAPGLARLVRPPAPQPQDASNEKRVRRGRIEIDARIDLHGMTQDQAQAALVRFLERLSGGGGRCGLVITGKGRAPSEGILRRRLPEWLAEPPLSGIVASFAPAHARHGGEGAWYVFVRKGRG
jgi:DNA-nicking Smr family endonuclease